MSEPVNGPRAPQVNSVSRITPAGRIGKALGFDRGMSEVKAYADGSAVAFRIDLMHVVLTRETIRVLAVALGIAK